MKRYFLIFGMTAMLAGCSKEQNPIIAEPPTLAKVEIHLSPEESTTRVVDENAIKDVNLFLYGKSDQQFYFTSSVLSFEIQAGTYQAYVVTNAHRDMGELSLDALRGYALQTEGMYIHEDIPMTAAFQLVVTSSGASSQTQIKVKRCAAKVAYSITVAEAVAERIELRSVQFCNIPRMITPFAPDALSSTNANNYDNGQVLPVGSDKSTFGVVYLFENKQGTVASIVDQKDKSPENAPACASYLRIFAQGIDRMIEYVVYLGENNTSDFNIRRNTQHQIDLIIRGENQIDNRVRVYEGLYYGRANSIICDGYQVRLDVTPYRTSKSRYYEYSGVYAGKEYEAVSAKVIWQGTANLISSLRLENNILVVNTNGKKGNAVVGVCDNAGTILWSFHIWCTAGDAPRDLLCENYKKARFYVMDRNLGAFANLPASYVDAGGLIYQWGRKDAFPSTNEDYVHTPTQSGVFLTLFPAKQYNQQSSVGTLEKLLMQTTRNPANFIYANYGVIWFNKESVNLWGDPEGYKSLYNTSEYKWSARKSVYDPCPQGYRVANKYTWTGFSRDGKTLIGDNNFGKTLTSDEINIVGVWNYGWRLRLTPTDVQGVYYPATQYRTLAGRLSVNSLNALKNISYYWSSTGGFDNRSIVPDDPYGPNVMSFQSNQLLLNDNYYGHSMATDPAFGFSVRCVRE